MILQKHGAIGHEFDPTVTLEEDWEDRVDIDESVTKSWEVHVDLSSNFGSHDPGCGYQRLSHEDPISGS